MTARVDRPEREWDPELYYADKDANPGAGLIHGLDEAEYHAHPTSLSVSGAKVLLKSPARYKWEREHPVHKDVFDFGTAAHKLVLGVGADLEVIHHDDWRTKAAREERDAARAAGKTPILRGDYDTVQAMADRLSEHRTAMALLSEGKPEVSAFCADEATGVMRRARFDWLNEDMLTDYKTAASSEPDAFGRAAHSFGYHMQAAWYLDIARDLGMEPRGFVFIVQEKTAPHEVTCIELTRDAVDLGRLRNQAALERFRDCTESGIWPGYAPDDRIVSTDLPVWAYRENLLEEA
ncbi:MAG TPA: PD-(D/E)XK nuclease-like domain-containing protein [Aeromicrobium sp.]|nr:PD-(D/E)XK nuclease-like domain-containing protein [Aeromicrobium sp.]